MPNRSVGVLPLITPGHGFPPYLVFSYISLTNPKNVVLRHFFQDRQNPCQNACFNDEKHMFWLFFFYRAKQTENASVIYKKYTRSQAQTPEAIRFLRPETLRRRFRFSVVGRLQPAILRAGIFGLLVLVPGGFLI